MTQSPSSPSSPSSPDVHDPPTQLDDPESPNDSSRGDSANTDKPGSTDISDGPGDQAKKPFGTMEGYNAPIVKQFSVFLDNRVGKMLELIEIFHDRPVSVAGMAVLDSTDHAVVRLVTSSGATARRTLREANLPFSEVDLLAIELSATPRALERVCTRLLSAEVSIHYMYPLLVRPSGLPVIGLYTDEQVLAGQILQRHGFVLFGEADLGQPG